jgi:hypothetical protein
MSEAGDHVESLSINVLMILARGFPAEYPDWLSRFNRVVIIPTK